MINSQFTVNFKYKNFQKYLDIEYCKLIEN